MMKLLRARVEIESPLVTPLFADTLFGHICWAIVFNEGEDKLKSFLNKYDEEIPPILLSNGFPKEMLPLPHLKPFIPENMANIKEVQNWKELKQHTYIPYQYFTDETFTFSLPKMLIALKDSPFKEKRQEKSIERMHNTINRISETTGVEGGLYAVKERWYEESGVYKEIYIQSTLEISDVEQLLQNALEFGYGADRSTGKGRITLKGIENCEFPDTGNRCMALANFVPDKNDSLEDLRAGVFTKYGKLGEHFVHQKNPFKKPIVMYQAGATWKHSADTKDYCGQLLKEIHSDPSIRHYALTPIIFYNEEEPND